MAVAPLDTGTAAYNAGATTQNYTFTISSGATLAVFLLVTDDFSSTITSVTLDPTGANQSCALVGSETCTTAASGGAFIYAVVNPTVGASKQLRVVQSLARGFSAEMQSYTGTVTSSVAAACTNALVANGTNSGTASHGTAAQSGANGDMYVSVYSFGGTINSVSDTSIDATGGVLSPAGNDAAYNRFASTGAIHSLTASMTGAFQWAAVSCDIVAAASAAPALILPRRVFLKR
jgi:hypothetical protein